MAKKTTTKKTTTKKTAKSETSEIKRQPCPQIADRRLEQIKFTMEDLKVDAMVVTFLPNIRYLSNFSGSAGTLFVKPDSIHFLTDDRYEEQIKTELYDLPNLHTYITRDVWKTAKEKKILKGIGSLGFEADSMPYSEAVDIRNKIRPVKFKPAPDEIERFNRPKSPEELESIKAATDMAVAVYEKMLTIIKPGMTEKEIAAEISYQGRLMGSEGDAFDIIAVSGPRSALVHGQPSDKKLKKNEILLLDFGCIVNGFHSDITRTIAIGKATKEQQKIYSILRKAQKNAIAQIRPGMNGKLLDKAARDVIKDAGYGDNFQHSLGHGIGLQTHEHPIITFRMDEEIIPEDAVLAIEPGIYLPDKFGMRVEDDVLVTRNGGIQLSDAPDEIVVI